MWKLLLGSDLALFDRACYIWVYHTMIVEHVGSRWTANQAKELCQLKIRVTEVED